MKGLSRRPLWFCSSFLLPIKFRIMKIRQLPAYSIGNTKTFLLDPDTSTCFLKACFQLIFVNKINKANTIECNVRVAYTAIEVRKHRVTFIANITHFFLTIFPFFLIVKYLLCTIFNLETCSSLPADEQHPHVDDVQRFLLSAAEPLPRSPLTAPSLGIQLDYRAIVVLNIILYIRLNINVYWPRETSFSLQNVT